MKHKGFRLSLFILTCVFSLACYAFLNINHSTNADGTTTPATEVVKADQAEEEQESSFVLPEVEILQRIITTLQQHAPLIYVTVAQGNQLSIYQSALDTTNAVVLTTLTFIP